jgi:hypothetical protein
VANRGSGASGTIHFSSTSVGQHWDLALTTGPGIPSALLTAGGQILNINSTDPTFMLSNGGFATAWPTQNWNQPYTAPAGTYNLSGQFAVMTPALADGVALSALNEIHVTPCAPGTQPLTLGDDTSVQVSLGVAPHCGVSSINFYGTAYTTCHVNSNGSVSFVQGSTDFTATVAEFTGQMPRLAGLWTDLNPGAGGTVTASSTPAGLLTVAWNSVPEFGTSVLNSFSIQFNTATGACSILNYAPGPSHGTDSLVGISPGGGAAGLPRVFSSYVGLGAQTGNATSAIYQFVTNAAPTGFARIDFPTSNGATFVVN